MKRSLPRAITFLVLTCFALTAFAGSRESAFRAKELAGPGVWSQVIKIKNAAPVEASRLPPEFYGLVVVFADIVWLYTEFDGTQNLSLRRGEAAKDLAQLGELLRAVDPDWVGFEVATRPPLPAELPLSPPNSCFPACVAQWQELLRAKRPPKEARLIACYAPGRSAGHMLLEFRKGWTRYVFDPERSLRPIRLKWGTSRDPLAVANAVLAARWAIPPARTSTVDIAPVRHAAPPRITATADSLAGQPRS
jgi:hypothetical protein